MGTSGLSSEFNLREEVPLHLLEFGKELRRCRVMGAGVASNLGPRAWHLLWFEAVALLCACRVEVATDAFELKFVHVLETANRDELWDVLVVQPKHTLRGRLFPSLAKDVVSNLGVHDRHLRREVR